MQVEQERLAAVGAARRQAQEAQRVADEFARKDAEEAKLEADEQAKRAMVRCSTLLC